MQAKIIDSLATACLDLNRLAQTAGGTSAWRENIGGQTHIVVEGCSQEALELALADKEVVADAQVRTAATAEAQTKQAWDEAKQMVDTHQSLEAVNCTFEITVPVLAALVRVVSALAIAKTPETADVKALTDALANLKTLAATFSDPTLSSSLTVPTPLGYIAYQRKQAAALRQVVAGG